MSRPSPSFKRLLLYATDAAKLSSLLIHRVLLTQPATLTAYRDATRQLLLDESRAAPRSASVGTANAAAVYLLRWERELNLVRYHGVAEYARRWWTSKPSILNRSSSSSSSACGGSNAPNSCSDGSSSAAANAGRVAFMITSNQRRELAAELGYSAKDIGSFKPLEAQLLLEHGVKKGSNFRERLQELFQERDRAMETQEGRQRQQSSPNMNEQKRDESDSNANIQRSSLAGSSDCLPSVDATPLAAPPPPMAVVDVTPHDAEQMHVTPDVAAALIASQQREPPPQQRLVERVTDDEGAEDDGVCWYEVVERVLRMPAGAVPKAPSGGTEHDERVIALFSTRREALECVRIKRSLRGRVGEARDAVGGQSEDLFLVRRRWNA